eukprot:TRINITY_DN14350_c0_g2_i2.p1 TRINITY_DN14350_c0_g2~~TRINITY_DN14350_c0_g2_i2.p1  ORF type:complete len:114 (+),score=6.45 TRINITY_DN14350_c0_g2_i2:31-342(+)
MCIRDRVSTQSTWEGINETVGYKITEEEVIPVNHPPPGFNVGKGMDALNEIVENGNRDGLRTITYPSNFDPEFLVIIHENGSASKNTSGNSQLLDFLLSKFRL